ncbi:hypothetical protein BMF94_3449 [Rhodotorula taiwanensis]|uniref:Xaa-Pro dipeptidyl-peptidase-like domain-containing protein n=1 Tax=Rhodotorula taiwanensis TaxID=741276 RepID=A0A2S5B9R6_9BASI|nr:hypothetical protein BMF94_3449 [Rhodotorula taiwanensis]
MTSPHVTVRHGTHTIEPGGPTLSYSLHQPNSARTDDARAAIIAHPYGRLGGCKEDHVVVAIVDALAGRGYTVLRYDARGSGSSTGSVSWTGAAEADDYRKMLDEVLLPAVLPNPDGSTPPQFTVVLAGYSYGSLAASACPPPEAPRDMPQLRVETSYLLVSYPLSVLWALCAFQAGKFSSALRTRVGGDQGEKVMAIFGDGDQFTGVDRYRTWVADLSNERFHAVEVKGADHFWRDRRVKGELLEQVLQWLHGE